MNELLNSIKGVIIQIHNISKKEPILSKILIEKSKKTIEGSLYSNILTNFFNNLNEGNVSEFGLKLKECKEVKEKFSKLLQKSLNEEEYKKFRIEIKDRYDSLLKLLQEVEKSLELDNCEDEINKLDKISENIKPLREEQISDMIIDELAKNSEAICGEKISKEEIKKWKKANWRE